MYQALYRAYRPEVFDEILGQKHIVRILQNQIAKDEIGHAYLLCWHQRHRQDHKPQEYLPRP